MRAYRLGIRLIQVATGLAFIVLIAGFFGVWGGKEPLKPDPVIPLPDVSSPQIPTWTNPKIVCLGDSFTQGYPLTPAQSWPKRLGDVLQVEVVNKGKAQQTAKDLLARFDADVTAENPGRVIIFAGIGDAIQGVPLADVKANIKAMVEKARAQDIVPILALPIGYPGFQVSIRAIREWETEYAKAEDIMLIDFSRVLFDEDGKFLSGLASSNDKYPNDKGYEKMGDYAAQLLKLE